MRPLDHKVVAGAIREDAHLAARGVRALDPSVLGLSVLVERLCFEPAFPVPVERRGLGQSHHALDLCKLHEQKHEYGMNTQAWVHRAGGPASLRTGCGDAPCSRPA